MAISQHPTSRLPGQLHRIDADLLGWWLCERQLPSGGFNGRPEKVTEPLTPPYKSDCTVTSLPQQLPDVCYSWWVLSSLKTIDRLHWIDADRLRDFILACQDDGALGGNGGGFAGQPQPSRRCTSNISPSPLDPHLDRPGDMVDPFHTLFGLAALSLLGEPALAPIHSIFCMPIDAIKRALGPDHPLVA